MVSEKKTYGKGPWSVTRSCPAGTAIETHSLVGNNLEQTTTTERLRVCLTLNLQDVKRKQNNLSDTDQARHGVSKNDATILSLSVWVCRYRDAHLPADACIMAFPVPFPKALSKSEP